MTPIQRLSSWLRQSLYSWPRQRRLRAVLLRLEELEHRTTPSGFNVVPEQFTTNQYTAISITQGQLLAGDTASAPLQISNLTQPANATLVDNNNGTFTFTPAPTFSGSTTFQYTVSTGVSQTQLAPNNGSVALNGGVAISGDTAVITNSGRGYVFVRSGSTWTQQATLTVADNRASTVAIDGNTAVLGSPSATVNSNDNQGEAFVFVRSGGTWTQQAKLTAADGAANDSFSESVAISGDTIVVGAGSHTVGSNAGQGAAYVFVRSATTWSLQQELTAADGIANDLFGSSVSVSGNTAVIGSGGISGPGKAYVFVQSGSTWSQQAELTASDGTAAIRTQIGRSSTVSIDGDTLVIGNSLQGPGAVYVFVRAGSTWSQQAKLTVAMAGDGSEIGASVAISGDTVVVGGAGVWYAFVRSGSTWSQQATFTAPDSFSGTSIGVSGGTAIISGGLTAYPEVQELSTGMATATATVQVNPATAQLSVSPARLSAGIEGQTYPSPTFTATGGAGSGYTFQESGVLPPGLTFDAATVQFVGSTIQIGTYPGIVIAASDGHGGSGSQTYTLTVSHFGVNGFPVPYPQTIYAPPTSKTDPNADLDAFIRGLYHSVLDRDAEPGATSLPYWENVFMVVQTNPQELGLAAGTDPYLYVAQGFWNSLEHRQDDVMSYYHDFLGRALDLSNSYDANGLTYWTNHFLLLGWQEADVVRGFLTSPEYLYDHRTWSQQAIELNYNLLSGVATTADLQTWNSALSALDMQRAAIQNQTFATPEDYKAQLSADLGALDDETAKTGVLFDMLRSSEYEQAAVQSFYAAILRRSGTSSEVQAWLAQRDASGNPLDLGSIATMLLASPEYRTNAANSVA